MADNQTSKIVLPYRDELNAVEKFARTCADAANLQDSKKFMQTTLSSFLQQLEVIKRFFKDKKYANYLDHFRKPILDEIARNGSTLIDLLKEIILIRQRDRAIRENCLRALKRLLKICGAPFTQLLYKQKIHIFSAFILEREFKSSAVAKER
jgi:hypothetical protein